MRHLVIVLGDQLNRDSLALKGFKKDRDAVWMAEVEEEATYFKQHKLRIAYFFACMRAFRDELEERDFEVVYHALTVDRAEDRGRSFREVLRNDVEEHEPKRLIVVQPGDHRVLVALQAEAESLGLPLEVREDRRFLCSTEEFDAWADGRPGGLLMESFYRHMRKTLDVLMDGDEPAGGKWNLDHDNRESFSASDPPPSGLGPSRFEPDWVTEEVIDLVAGRFADHPGRLEHFTLPVSAKGAKRMLQDFIARDLPKFGMYEDAMWDGEDFLYHSRISAPLNLGLIDPRDCLKHAVQAYEKGAAPLNSVEGFVRQILGWREFVRGVYWRFMPEYAERNHLDAHADLPAFYWTGETDMACVAGAMRSVIDHGYTHHIQRLMVLGNLALNLGVHPLRFHEWHVEMYLDSVDWASLPNTLGMSQYGDGGVVGTKPYCASGNYISKMSNYCSNCRYDPKQSAGENACPQTVFYWDFLARHEDRFRKNHRMKFQIANVRRKRDKGELPATQCRADELRDEWGVGGAA
ncbi:cryptochrome/photolyase family protein [Alienimonas chondri]|uniref:(6-4) photolyase n=1 Tax=Alienimonas chondri TaxID=2681879 RepID=A0ABX1VF45_9PLAN|nr:cryptochrome/photolyase family protein [Alienimonas chondri]NNJ26135.1 (6-4) photolyase [Alienimonas chondri]